MEKPNEIGSKYIRSDWDNQWRSESDYLQWLETIFAALSRVLKKSGSFYCFCSNRLEHKTIPLINQHFHALNAIVWAKTNGGHNRTKKERCIRYFPQSERVIFAEHHDAENQRKQARIKQLSPLISYFSNAFKNAPITASDIHARFGTYTHRHWFSYSQWAIPNQAQYIELQRLIPQLNRSYTAVRAEYDELYKNFYRATGARLTLTLKTDHSRTSGTTAPFTPTAAILARNQKT